MHVQKNSLKSCLRLNEFALCCGDEKNNIFKYILITVTVRVR